MSQTGTIYRPVDEDYFDRRGLRRYTGIASLWALGVGVWFAAVGRHRLVLSPEEAFAVQAALKVESSATV